jgi:Flp pilus assembly protein TadG
MFQHQRSRRRQKQRRGATLVEMTLVILLFLALIFGMLDLGILLTRLNSLTQAARSGARAAIVRGEFADVLGRQGPTAYSGTAAEDHPITNAVRRQLIVMDPSQVTVNVTWTDGNNELGSRVRVSASAGFTPMMTFIFGSPTWTLTGSSEMHIAH